MSPISFCLFCYKDISSVTKLNENLYDIKKFYKFLNRFVESEKFDSDFALNTNYACNLINTCYECESILNSFCELYNQLKCLELKLDAKLIKLVEKIELSNKIPSRWINVKKALEFSFQNDTSKIEETRGEIWKIRQDVVQSRLQRAAKSQPRVSMERLNKAVLNILSTGDNSSHSLEADGSVEESWNDEAKSTVDDYQLIEIKQEFPPSLFRETDNNATDQTPSSLPFPEVQVNSGVIYTQCEICGKRVAALLKNKHYRMSHDLTKVSHEYQIFRCNFDSCAAYFLSKRQLKDHHSEIHETKKKICESPSSEYLEGVKYFRCEICKTPFDNLQTYKRHVSSTNCAVESEKTIENVECPKCREKFETKNDLWMHQHKIHSTDKTTVCPKCGKFFREIRRFKSHLEYHKGPTQWKWECKECGKRSATVHQLKRHILIHKKADDDDWTENDWIIEHKNNDEDNEDLNDNGAADDQLEIESGPDVLPPRNKTSNEPSLISSSNNVSSAIKCVCSQCGKRFTDGLYLKRHMMRVHCKTGGMNWQCGKCGKKFVNKWNVRSHMKLNKCDKKFKGKNLTQGESQNSHSAAAIPVPVETNMLRDPLELDIKTEINEEDCLVSEMSISNPGTLDNQVKCKDCDELFDNDKSLWLHQSEDHFKHVCKLCGKEFNLKTGLKLHLEYHKDPQDWKWECGECGKKCATKHKLNEHRRTHTGIKPYSCPLCSERFGFPQNLRRHCRVQHGMVVEMKSRVPKVKSSTRVTCKYCKGEFAHKASLQRHCKLMHKYVIEEKLRESYGNDRDLLNGANTNSSGDGDPLEILP